MFSNVRLSRKRDSLGNYPLAPTKHEIINTSSTLGVVCGTGRKETKLTHDFQFDSKLFPFSAFCALHSRLLLTSVAERPLARVHGGTASWRDWEAVPNVVLLRLEQTPENRIQTSLIHHLSFAINNLASD